MMTQTVLSAAAPALSHPCAPDNALFRFSRVTGRGSRLAEFLIANLELEIPASPRKQTSRVNSNRKYFVIFATQGREFIPSVSASGHRPEPLAPPYPRNPLPAILSSFEPQASSLQNLIGTPRLEIAISPILSAISNFLIGTKRAVCVLSALLEPLF